MTAIATAAAAAELSCVVEEVSGAKRRIRFTIPGQAVNSAFTSSAARIAAKARLPGFRPGKVPPSLIERQYAADVRRGALDKLLEDHVFKAISQTALRAVGRPEVESFSDLARGQDMQVAIIIEIIPEVTVVGYQDLTLTVDAFAADEHDFEHALEEKARKQAQWAPVTENAQDGDEVVADFALVATPMESAKPYIESDKRFVIGDSRIPMQVNEAVRGAKPGDEIARNFAVTPDDAHFSASEAVHVSLKVHEIQRMDVPAVDDELAKDLGHADLAALRAAIDQDLQAQAARKNRDQRQMKVLDHLLSVNPFDVPAALVETLVDDQISQMFGHLDAKTQRSLGRFLDGMRTDMRRDAESALRRSLVLDAVAKQLQVQASDEDLQAYIDSDAVPSDADRKTLQNQLAQEGGKHDLTQRVINHKALEQLVASVTWTVDKTVALHGSHDADSDEGDDHDHDHDHDHGHSHDHDHDHDHAHGHSHA